MNGIAPGPVWTPLQPSLADQSMEKLEKFGADVPMGRPGSRPSWPPPLYCWRRKESSYVQR